MKNKLSKNVLKEVSTVISQTREEAEKCNIQFIKLKDNTIKQLVNYGIDDLPMLERVGHVRENILTEEQADKLRFSIRGKDYHGLGVKKYLEIINAMDNPIGIYQYTEKGKYDKDNFIIVTPIKLNNTNYIVPIKINNKPGQYNQVEVQYNRIKTVYVKNNNDYISNMLKEGKIKEIFIQSNSEQISLNKNNIPQINNIINNDILPNNSNIQKTKEMVIGDKNRQASPSKNNISQNNNKINYNTSINEIQNESQNKICDEGVEYKPTSKININNNKSSLCYFFIFIHNIIHIFN